MVFFEHIIHDRQFHGIRSIVDHVRIHAFVLSDQKRDPFFRLGTTVYIGMKGHIRFRVTFFLLDLFLFDKKRVFIFGKLTK